MKPSGKVELSLLLFLAAVAAVIFGAVRIAPVYMDNMDVQQVLTAVVGQANNLNDSQMRRELERQLSNVGTHVVEDEDGTRREVDGFVFPEEDVVIDRDTVRHTVRMSVRYDRSVNLHPVPRIVTFHFEDAREAPLGR